MIATIVKSSTEIEVINDQKFDLKRDGGFDTVEIHFYSTDDDLLNRYDRVTFNSQTWRVIEQPTVKINYEESPEWLYTIVLSESAILLSGIQLPNITFTQDTDATKTLEDAITNILLKQKDIITTESQNFTLASSPSVDLSAIAPSDVFEDKNLYQVLKYYGELVDAKVVLDESTNEIDFEYLNDDNGTVLTPTITSIEKSKPVKEYSTDIIEDIENAITNEYAQYPFGLEKIYATPLDLNEQLSYSNSKLELPHNVSKVYKVIVTDGTTTHSFYSELSGLITTQYLFEQAEWETLRESSFFSFIPHPSWGALRTNSLYYKYGDNQIYNLSMLTYWYTALVPIAGLTFYVQYKPLMSVQLSKKSGNEIDGGYSFTTKTQQQYNVVDYSAESIRVKNELRNNQSYYYNVLWEQDTLPNKRSKLSVLGNEYLMTRLVATKVGNIYECNAKVASEYNPKNVLTKAINQNRLFTIPNSQTTERKVIMEVDAEIDMQLSSYVTSTGKWADYNYNIMFCFQSYNIAGELNYYYSGYVMTFIEFEHDNGDYVACGFPLAKAVDTDKIVLVTKMITNTSADYQRTIDSTIPTNYTAQSSIITDEDGKIKNLTVKYIMVEMDDVTYNDGTDDYDFLSTYPFVSEDFYTDGTLDTTTTKKHYFDVFDSYKLNKDSREQLQFENVINISTTDNVVSYNENLYPAEINNTTNQPTIKAKIDGVWVNCTNEVLTFHPTYMVVHFDYGATGTLTDILLTDSVGTSDMLMLENINKTVTSGDSDFVTVGIKEE